MDNKTVIDVIVNKSRDCIVKRFIKDHLKKSWVLAKIQKLPSANTIKIVIDELDLRINELESDIGRLFEPLFEGKDFGHKDSKKHSLSISEIRDGYIMLGGEEYVILLNRLYNNDLKNYYEPGILYPLTPSLERQLSLLKANYEILSDDILNLIIKRKEGYEYIKK